jgi:hypothetical protein
MMMGAGKTVNGWMAQRLPLSSSCPGLVRGIHVFIFYRSKQDVDAGASPAMTEKAHARRTRKKKAGLE